MARPLDVARWLCLVLLMAAALAGCSSQRARVHGDSCDVAPDCHATTGTSGDERIALVSHQAPIEEKPGTRAETPPVPSEVVPSPAEKVPAPAAPAPWSTDPGFPVVDASDPLFGDGEFSPERLAAEVLARNPSLQAMAAAWRAAAERYPQVISLEDPMFAFTLGPAGLGRDGGWMVMASQKLPWWGKRGLKGSVAAAEADAACQDVAGTRLMLAEAAAMAFLDYYLARRELEVNKATTELMQEFREIAKAKYEASQVSQQDVLQANLELADLEGRQAELLREEKVAIARINTLLHRAADHPLPPPPAKLEAADHVPPADALHAAAVRRRPDLAADAARIRAEEAAVALACREFYPDVEMVAKYDAFMPEEMRSQVGMNVNVPIRRGRRCGALLEAQARLQQRRAEYQGRLDQIHFEVQSAVERLAEGRRIVALYEEKILPAAEDNAASARANYQAGKVDFLRLIEALRQLQREKEKYHQATAAFHRRVAELERVVGRAG